MPSATKSSSESTSAAEWRSEPTHEAKSNSVADAGQFWGKFLQQLKEVGPASKERAANVPFVEDFEGSRRPNEGGIGEEVGRTDGWSMFASLVTNAVTVGFQCISGPLGERGSYNGNA